ncbi:MAG TPA: tetratricopeptide repeat protein [Polyangiaceae bacterium]|nr:tetratricopeptide repeat protein [Polyangiaceae bacterium]
MSGLRVLVSTDLWSSSALEEKSGYYRPVASLSLALNRFLAGNSTIAYHAGNVLLHALNATMLFRFLSVRKIATGPRAVGVVLLFATLPLVAEPVSWIAGRYDLLGLFFALLALEANTHARRALMAPILFGLAVLSKEPFAVLPVFLFLDDVLLFRRSALREAVKYVLLALALGGTSVLRAWAHVPQAATVLTQSSVAELARAYAFAWDTYGRLAFWPNALCFFHTYVPPSTIGMTATLTALSAIVVSAFWWTRRRPRDEAHAAVLFGVVWCLVAMLPGALTAPTLRIIGDRYAYFPLVGVVIALGGLMERTPHGVRGLVVVPLLALVGAQTVRLESRLSELKSEDSMFRATLARDPDNFTTLTLFGTMLAKNGHYAEAEGTLLHARAVAPTTGDIDTALAFVHLRQRRYAEAEADGWRAVAGKPQNPRAWVNLASALVDEKRPAAALDASAKALALRPGFAEAHFVRALALLQLGQFDAAHDEVIATLNADPNHSEARSMIRRFHGKPAR